MRITYRERLPMKVLILLGTVAAALLFTEAVLRFGFGFGNPPLYVADEAIGYRLAPNQQVRRFGNRIAINEYSLRAEAIPPLPAADTLRLFLLGDSIANGNWWTDQRDILSELLAARLRGMTTRYAQIEAINASANSWGPRNELAYVERYGLFGSQVLILLINTDDLFGTQPTSLQVGRDRNYPSRKPPFAMVEALDRLFNRQQQPIPGLAEIQAEEGDRVGKNIAAMEAIYRKATADGAQFMLVLSPLERELAGPRDYELVARQRLKDWASEMDISYLDLLVTYQKQADPQGLFRDNIHLSPAGNQLVSETIVKNLNPRLLAP
jgi:lysophospholipase L1-like esterase